MKHGDVIVSCIEWKKEEKTKEGGKLRVICVSPLLGTLVERIL
jgi:hypothetical protein